MQHTCLDFFPAMFTFVSFKKANSEVGFLFQAPKLSFTVFFCKHAQVTRNYWQYNNNKALAILQEKANMIQLINTCIQQCTFYTIFEIRSNQAQKTKCLCRRLKPPNRSSPQQAVMAECIKLSNSYLRESLQSESRIIVNGHSSKSKSETIRFRVIVDLINSREDKHLLKTRIMNCNNLIVRSVPEISSPLRSLVQLDLSNNLICSIEKIGGYAMPRLKNLYMANNHITSIRALRKCVFPQLGCLDLNRNKISDFDALVQFKFQEIQVLQLLQRDRHVDSQIVQQLVLKANFPCLEVLETYQPTDVRHEQRLEAMLDIKHDALFLNNCRKVI